MKRLVLGLLALAAVLPGTAHAGGPTMLIGAAEDAVRQPTLVGAKAQLAQTYDALKAVSRDIVVLGGALSPHGGDDPNSTRLTHSPTAFITDMGAFYRASGRIRPIMDGLALHPYEDNSSIAPVNGRH